MLSLVIQNHGEAEAVMTPVPDSALLQEARERRRRQRVIAQLRQIAQVVGERNANMPSAAAAQLADEVTIVRNKKNATCNTGARSLTC